MTGMLQIDFFLILYEVQERQKRLLETQNVSDE